MKTKFNFLIFIVVGFIGCGPKVTSNKIVRDANQFSNKELWNKVFNALKVKKLVFIILTHIYFTINKKTE